MSTIEFSHETPDYAFLINEFASPFYKGDTLWQSATQFIAWSMLNPKGMDKKQAANNRKLRDKIVGAFDPWKCRYFMTKKGLAANNAELRQDAEAVEDKILRMAIEAKFGQNPMLLVLLIKTGDDKLIYANKYDEVLGSGSGKGKNKLGKALMKFRDKVTNEYSGLYTNPVAVFDVCAAICEHILVGESE